MPGPMRDPSPGAGDRILRGLRRDTAGDRPEAAPGADLDGGQRATTSGDTDGAAIDLERWSVRRLRRRAALLGVAGRSTMTKAELVAAIRAR